MGSCFLLGARVRADNAGDVNTKSYGDGEIKVDDSV